MSPGNQRRLSVAIGAVTHTSSRAWHIVGVAFQWLFAPLVDDWTGLSLNRFLAIVFGITAVHGQLTHETPITWADIAFAVIAGSLSFGKDVWTSYLDRKDHARDDTRGAAG